MLMSCLSIGADEMPGKFVTTGLRRIPVAQRRSLGPIGSPARLRDGQLSKSLLLDPKLAVRGTTRPRPA